MSLTVIGIYMLFGACLMPVNILAHAPAFLLGTDFRGWKAVLFFTAMGALDAVFGIALLWLAPWSRMAAIYFFIFRMANLFVTFSFPGTRVRFEEGVDAMRAALGQHSARRSPVWFGPVFELALMGVVLWILLTSKQVLSAPGDGTTTASARRLSRTSNELTGKTRHQATDRRESLEKPSETRSVLSDSDVSEE